MNTAELLKLIQLEDGPLLESVQDFDVDELVRLLDPRVVQTSGKNYGIARDKGDPTNFSDSTVYFDWHSDGMYHPKPPRFVLLHCLDAGTGMARTELANVSVVLRKMRPESLKTLGLVRSHYVGRGGSTSHHPVLHDDDGMLLASRGFVDTMPTVALKDFASVRDIGAALAELFSLLDANVCLSHAWSVGDTLVFDQYRYMHRRIGGTEPDLKRQLVRLWFD